MLINILIAFAVMVAGVLGMLVVVAIVSKMTNKNGEKIGRAVVVYVVIVCALFVLFVGGDPTDPDLRFWRR